MQNMLARFVTVKANERRALFYSFLYFFCLLSGYYMLRPIRDEMAVRVGVDDLNILLWCTFIGMLLTIPLFGWCVSRFSRATLIPTIYSFFVLNLLIFFNLYHLDYLFELPPLAQDILAAVFFVWVSIYNLFVISVFWSFMADIYDADGAKRLFAMIAAGGTTGTLMGSLVTTIVTSSMTTNGSEAASWLILLCACLLSVAIVCVRKLNSWHEKNTPNVMGGKIDGSYTTNVWSAFPLLLKSPYLLGICVLVFLYSLLSTFLYFMQADIVKSFISDSQQRIALFASIDFIVNSLTLLLQLFITSRIVRRFGLALSLLLIPIMLGVGFTMIATFAESEMAASQSMITLPWAQGLQLTLLPALLLIIQILRRAGQYAINRPAREMLYTVVSTEEKYRAKNLIDTTIFRGGDAVSGQVYSELAEGFGLKLSTIAWIAVPLCGVWAVVSFGLGKSHKRKSKLKKEFSAISES